MKMRSLLAASLVLMLGLSGCSTKAAVAPINESKSVVSSDKAQEKNELVLAIGGEPDEGFDPCTGWGRYGSPLFQSTLLAFDENMEFKNDLATEYSISDNSLTWTFKIRNDAKFTDGTKVTAEDVAFTFNTAKASSSEVDLSSMKEARAIDDTKVEFLLNSSMSAFANIAVSVGIVPKHLYSTGYAANPVGSGPYKFVQWDKGQQLIVTRNDDYYGDKPAFEKLTFLFIGEDTALAAVQSKTVDVAMTSPLLVQELDGYSLLRCKSVDNRGMSMPVTMPGTVSSDGIPVGNAVTSDIAIRKALIYGISRQEIVENTLGGYGTAAYSICDELPWWNPETRIKDGDVEGMKQYLIEMGWVDTNSDGIVEKNGVPAKINLLYPASDSARQALSIAFSQEAKKLGIEINVEGKGWDDIGQRMYSDCVMFGWGSHNPMEMYNLYFGKSNLTVGYNNPTNAENFKVDEYMDLALRSRTPEEANEYWKKAQWDGQTGLSNLGDASWCWIANVEHLYYVRDGLDLGKQQIHPHGHGFPVVANITEWKLK